MDSREASGTRPWLAVGQEIAELLERIDAEGFARAADICGDPATRWFFSGQGRSGLCAQMVAMRFMHMGRDAHFVGEASAPAIRDGDALMVISGSGETPVSVAFARIAKAEGALVLAVTRSPQSELARFSDITLHIPADHTQQFGGTLFEQGILLLLDSLVGELSRRVPHGRQLMQQRHTNFQ
jgi:6-phospho-3-hexuloisomerase